MPDKKLTIIIDAENKTKQAFEGIKGSLDKTQKKLKSMAPTFKKMAVAGTVAFGAIAVGVKKAVKNASDLEESINAVEVVFGKGAKNILKFGESAATSVGMTTAAFNQMSTQTGALLKDTGLSADEVAGKTINLTTRAADMASVFNTDVSDAMSAINQALRGETEAIRRYAGDVTDATLETYALSQGIEQHVADMTQQEKRLLRIDLIMAQTAVTAGDFANTSDSLANRQRILGATLENISATLGATFIPIIQKVLDKLVPVITKVSEWINENPKLAKNIIIVAGVLTGLVAVVGALGLILPSIIGGIGAVGAALTFFAKNPAIIAIAAIAALVAMIMKAVNAYKQLRKETEATKESGEKTMELAGKLDPLIEKAKKAGDMSEVARLSEMKEGSIEDAQRAIGVGNTGFFKNIAVGLGLSQYADGGVVPGAIGQPQLAVVHGGEEVLTAEEAGGKGGNTFNFTFNGDVTDKQEFIRRIKEEFSRSLSLKLATP